MKKSSIATMTATLLFLAGCGCNANVEENDPPMLLQYAEQDFTITAWWAPYEISKESYTMYAASGLNTMLLVNHSGERNSENQYYLSSKATENALKVCKEMKMPVVLNYFPYLANALGANYSQTPFSQYDIYGEYKDIIKGVHIDDEPSAVEMETLGNDVFTDDFKSVYDASFFINLFPTYADEKALGVEKYKDYVDCYVQNILTDFDENRLLSVDFYPFTNSQFRTDWLYCYEMIADAAKKNGAKTNYFIQCAEGNEFRATLSEAELRMQVYMALCFGGDWISYYCYSNPLSGEEEMYSTCMVDKDGKPTKLYYYVQNINQELNALSNVALAYDYVGATGVTKTGEKGSMALRMLSKVNDFTDFTYVQAMETSSELVVSSNKSEKGEGYMLVHYADPVLNKSAEISLTLKDTKYLAVYKGVETPKIMTANAERKINLTLQAGEGIFVVPLV